MERSRYSSWVILIMLLILNLERCGGHQSDRQLYEDLKIRFEGKHAQIEVGGPYAGIEMHNSAPAINRISFYYPVANSLDLSRDYWQRERDHVFFIGLKWKDKKRWIGLDPMPFEITPYSAVFLSEEEGRIVRISYNFCYNSPALVIQIEFTNCSQEEQTFEIYTHLETSLRTCHTYRPIDRAWTEVSADYATVATHFDSPETGSAVITVDNAGLLPNSVSTRSEVLGLPGSGENIWMQSICDLPGDAIDQGHPERSAVAFLYRDTLESGAKTCIVQIVASARENEAEKKLRDLRNTYQNDVVSYGNGILGKIFEKRFLTRDSGIDHTVHWAKAILETNRHYLDGAMLPMPCPAQYNFYFTHDVLLTDLGAVLFDIERVRRDLLFIQSHTDSLLTIPHAYYWKDDRYVTEFAGADNWNHFWFLILASRYYRHSGDKITLERLYPVMQRSVSLTLSQKGDDHLIHAGRPDWWDIGHVSGPRAYMTLLAVEAIREFLYVSLILNGPVNQRFDLMIEAKQMQDALTDRLWNDRYRYLMNDYTPGVTDPHLYMGSLLAAHFGLLDPIRTREMVETTGKVLLDSLLGVYTVFPMDFNEKIAFFRFQGNEAGDPFLYLNGGIWPHANAWYALALMANGAYEEALQFMKRTMMLDGIMDSPSGQPAMYEYRMGNPASAVYGKIDKPQFLWAAGWTLYNLYHVFGVHENSWNIRLKPAKIENTGPVLFDLMVKGRNIEIMRYGSGQAFKSILYDGEPFPSAVLPEDALPEKIAVHSGRPVAPYLADTNAILESCMLDEERRRMTCVLHAFSGYRTHAEVISPWKILNVQKRDVDWNETVENGIRTLHMEFDQKALYDTLVLNFVISE